MAINIERYGFFGKYVQKFFNYICINISNKLYQEITSNIDFVNMKNINFVQQNYWVNFDYDFIIMTIITIGLLLLMTSDKSVCILIYNNYAKSSLKFL